MRNRIIFIGAVVFFSALLIVFKYIYYSPKISFSETSWNFGEVFEGELLKHQITISNHGLKKVSLNLMSSCSCLTIEPDNILLEPKEEKTVELIFDTIGYFFQVKHYLYIMNFDSRKHETVVITGLVKKNKKAQIRMIPKVVDFTRITRNKLAILEVILNNVGSEPFEISRIETSSLAIEGELSSRYIGPNNIIKLKVNFDASKINNQQYFEGMIKIYSANADVAAIELPIKAVID
jgi:hypothetical protein